MIHSELFKKFAAVFPVWANDTKEWFPNGKNSIRIRLKTEKEYIFSSENEDAWRFETISSFLNSMNGGI